MRTSLKPQNDSKNGSLHPKAVSSSGDLTSGGLTFGGYALREFVTNIFSEAYAAVGAGRNQLHLGDGHLTVDGDYDSTEMHLGWIVSGLIEKGRWEFWPEVAVQWSQSKTSTVTVSGAIPGSTTSAAWDGLTTALGTATFATEVVYNFGTQDDPWSVRFKPGILCEDTRAIAGTSHCGTTLTVGLDRESGDNRRRLAVEASVEDVGTGARKSASVSYELRF